MKYILLFLFFICMPTFAQTRIVVPVGVGSVADTVVRKSVPFLSDNVIIENRPGAGSVVGINYFLSKPTEDHVLIIGIANFFMSDFTHPDIANFKYDSFNYLLSFSDIITAVYGHHNMVNIEKLMKGKDMRIAYTSTSQKIALSMLTNGKISSEGFIGYKSGPDMHFSTIRGDTFYFFQPLGGAIHLAKSGKLRLYAVGTDKRMTEFPTVPTMKEINRKMTFSDSYVVVVNKNLNNERVNQYRKLFARLETDNEFKKFLTDNYLIPTPHTQTHMNDVIKGQLNNRPLYQKYSK